MSLWLQEKKERGDGPQPSRLAVAVCHYSLRLSVNDPNEKGERKRNESEQPATRSHAEEEALKGTRRCNGRNGEEENFPPASSHHLLLLVNLPVTPSSSVKQGSSSDEREGRRRNTYLNDVPLPLLLLP